MSTGKAAEIPVRQEPLKWATQEAPFMKVPIASIQESWRYVVIFETFTTCDGKKEALC